MHKAKIPQNALRSINKLTAYVQREFSQARADRFSDEIFDFIDSLGSNPSIYPFYYGNRYKTKDLRRRLFDNRTAILFKIYPTYVSVVAVRDTRSNWK